MPKDKKKEYTSDEKFAMVEKALEGLPFEVWLEGVTESISYLHF